MNFPGESIIRHMNNYVMKYKRIISHISYYNLIKECGSASYHCVKMRIVNEMSQGVTQE